VANEQVKGSLSGSKTGNTNEVTDPTSNWMMTGMPDIGPDVLLASFTRETSASTLKLSSPAFSRELRRQQLWKKAWYCPGLA